MGKRIAALLLPAVMALTLLAACGDQGELYPGEKYQNFMLSETFLTNVSGEDRHYVQCNVMLELSDDQMIPALTEKEHRLNGIVIEAVRSRTLDELKDADVQADILSEIVERSNAAFNTNKITMAFFTHFTVIRQ